MRDILTVIASLVILVLAAALIAPPLIHWEARRAMIDRAISRAAGTDARTEGRIEVRLLPSPRIRIDHLRLGSPTSDAASLSARFVKAEVALAPLLSGKVRFTETRVGRAEIRVPVSADGGVRLPPELAGRGGPRREWAFEDLLVSQLLITTVAPATGRTNQAYAENVRIEGQSLAGPWRVEGMTAGVPFRLATGELGPDQTVQVKLAGGGDIYPRFDIDAKLGLNPGADAVTPNVSGTARVLFGPPAQGGAAGIPIPVSVQTTFKAAGQAVVLEPFTLEAGEGGASLRLTGGGSIGLDDPRVSLKLEGRRLDVDSFILSPNGQDFLTRRWSLPPLSVPVDLDLTLDSIGLAQEELTNLVFRGSLVKGQAQVDALEVTAPGETRIAVAGELGLTTQGGAGGRVAVSSKQSGRLARYLGTLGLGGPLLTPLDGRPFEAAAEVTLASPVASFRNLRAKIGDATLTGAMRYTAREGQARGQLQAQVAMQGLDIRDLPPLHGVFDATRDMDLGIILDARDVRHGDGPGAGRIGARILSDGSSLVVEALDIVDLAGANAQVQGRIDAQGSGRIAGKITARRAAPLVDLLGRVWVGGVSKLVPSFLREGDLDLDVAVERAPPSDPNGTDVGLKTSVRGTAAGGRLDADVLSTGGQTESLVLKVATDNTGRWVDRPDVGVLRRPSNLDIKGVRVGSGQFNVTATGDIGGVKVATARPFALGAGDEVVDSGEVDLTTADVTPFLVLLGDGAGVDPPVPVQAHVTLGRERDASLFTVKASLAGNGVQARLAARSRGDVNGTVTLDRVSLPWLAASFALNAPNDPKAAVSWSTVRFGQTRRLVSGGQVGVKARRIDFGRGLEGADAAFTFAITPDGIAIHDLKSGFAGGRLAATATITRQGSLAAIVGEGTIEDAALPGILGATALDGRLSAALRFGASGETVSGLVANLAGSGEARLSAVQVPGADPGAVDRALARALREDDPLAADKLKGLVGEELARAPFQAPATTAPATLIGGALRLSPAAADAGPALWQGAITVDLKALSLDARGILSSKTSPKGWTGSPPAVALGWRGPLANPVRDLDVGPLSNGLAALVLQRELERVEALEAEGNERQRLGQRLGMDRERRAAEDAARRAAEEAARQARLREQREADEAVRQARLREQAEAVRARAAREQAEAARAQAAREQAEAARAEPPRPGAGGASGPPGLRGPIDIRPNPQRSQPGG